MPDNRIKTLSSNYIVRIYRRDKKCPLNIIGILEDVSTERIWKFSTIEELIGLFTGIPRKKQSAVHPEKTFARHTAK